MTATDIFAIAAGYMTQSVSDSEDLAEFVPGMLNVLLAEALPYENALRRYDGSAELTAAPVVTAGTMDTEIAYHDELTRIALPYGLAADFYRDDENYAVMDDFRGRYVGALSDSLRVSGAEDITDVYPVTNVY